MLLSSFIIEPKARKLEKVSMKTHNKCRQVSVGEYRFERVSSFLDLGSIINDDNSISEEITH